MARKHSGKPVDAIVGGREVDESHDTLVVVLHEIVVEQSEVLAQELLKQFLAMSRYTTAISYQKKRGTLTYIQSAPPFTKERNRCQLYCIDNIIMNNCPTNC